MSRDVASVLLVPFAAAIACAATSGHYGVSWDEKVQRDYGVLSWQYFQSLGEDTRCNRYLNLRYYTPAYEVLLHVASLHAAAWQGGPPAYATPEAAEYAVRHLINSMVGCISLLAVALFSRQMRSGIPTADTRAAVGLPRSFLAPLLLVGMPRYYGHFFANTKDIPFAAAFAWCMVAVLGTLQAIKPHASTRRNQKVAAVLRLPIAHGVGTAALIGFTVSLRSAGLLILPLGAVGLCGTLYNAHTEHMRHLQYPSLSHAVTWLLLCVGAFWVALVALWPAAHVEPFWHPVRTVLESTHFSTVVRMRFGGVDVWSNALPRHYYLEMLGATLPVPTLLCVVTGAIHAAATLTYHAQRQGGLGTTVDVEGVVAQAPTEATAAAAASTESSTRLPVPSDNIGPTIVCVDVAQLLALLWALGPLLIFWVAPFNVYDGVRHFLFIFPALALLGAAPVSMVRGRAAVCGVALCVVIASVPTMVHLHPYETSYFSDAVGGLGTVGGQEPPVYDTDYWATCYREATQWVSAHAAAQRGQQQQQQDRDSPTRELLAAANSFSLECIKPYLPTTARHSDNATNGSSGEPLWTVTTTLDAAAKRLPTTVDYYIATTRWGMHQLYPDSTVIHRVKREGVTLCLVKSDRPGEQAFADANPRSAATGGAPHQLLSVETIQDGNHPPSQHLEPQPQPQLQPQSPPRPPAPESQFPPAPLRQSVVSSECSQGWAGIDCNECAPGYTYSGDKCLFLITATTDNDNCEENMRKMTSAPTKTPTPTPTAATDPDEPVQLSPAGSSQLQKIGGLGHDLEADEQTAQSRVQTVKLPEGSIEDHGSAAYAFALANALRDKGRVAEAIQAYAESTRRDESSPAPFNNLGALLEASGRVPEALHVYRQAVAQHPEFALGFFNLGSRLTMELQRQVQEHGPNAVTSLQWEEPLRFLGRSLELNPVYYPGWSNFGDAKRGQGHLEGALQCYRKALALEPSYAVALNNLGNTLKLSGRLPEAAVQYAHAATMVDQKGTKTAAMWGNLGAVYMEQDRLAEALEAYQNATLASPDYAPAYANMGRIYEDQGMLEQARQHYRQAYTLEPTDALELGIGMLLPPIMPRGQAERDLTIDDLMVHLDKMLLRAAGDGEGRPRFGNPVDDMSTMGFYLSYLLHYVFLPWRFLSDVGCRKIQKCCCCC